MSLPWNKKLHTGRCANWYMNDKILIFKNLKQGSYQQNGFLVGHQSANFKFDWQPCEIFVGRRSRRHTHTHALEFGALNIKPDSSVVDSWERSSPSRSQLVLHFKEGSDLSWTLHQIVLYTPGKQLQCTPTCVGPSKHSSNIVYQSTKEESKLYSNSIRGKNMCGSSVARQ